MNMQLFLFLFLNTLSNTRKTDQFYENMQL